MTNAAPEQFIDVEFRINNLFGDPADVAAKLADAARFVEIASAAGFVPEEKGESSERWFSIAVPTDRATALLDQLAIEGLEVALHSDEISHEDPFAQQLSVHPATGDADFAQTAAEIAAWKASIAAANARPLSERDPWAHAVTSRFEVRVTVQFPDGSTADGWCQVDGMTPEGIRTPRISLDDGRTVFGNDYSWNYVKPFAYRPLPAASVPERISFDFTLTAAVPTGGNAIDPDVLREATRKALAEALSNAGGPSVIGDISLGLDGRALPTSGELYERAWGGTPYGSESAPSDDIFDRPFDPDAPSPDNDEDGDAS